MIGLIVTGHGNFATGLTSSLKLIAGEPKNYVAVDFLESYSVDDLERELTKALDELKDCIHHAARRAQEYFAKSEKKAQNG